jgi:hypothetical protein
MALNLKELDKKIHQRKMELEELEEFRSLLEKYGDVVSSKNGSQHRPSAKKPPRRAVRSTPPPPNSNGLKDAILGLDMPLPVTVDNIVEMLHAKNLNFHRRQVRDCVYVLVKKHKGFRRAKEGKGGKPSLYERVGGT